MWAAPEFCQPIAGAAPYGAWAVLVVAFIAYGVALRLRRRDLTPWSYWRTASFVIGLVIIAVALLPDLPGAAGSAVRHHMISHVLLAMMGPIAVVLGCPTTLVIQALPREAARKLVGILRARPVHLITRPAVAAPLNVGVMFLLYLTPLYAMALDRPVLSGLLHLHFFFAGYLFAWVIANQDRVPGQSSFLARLVALGLSAAAHAYLAKLMFAEGWPRGTGEPLDQVQAAAQIMYYGGDVAELLLAAALFGQWYATRRAPPHEAARPPAIHRPATQRSGSGMFSCRIRGRAA